MVAVHEYHCGKGRIWDRKEFFTIEEKNIISWMPKSNYYKSEIRKAFLIVTVICHCNKLPRKSWIPQSLIPLSKSGCLGGGNALVKLSE